MVASSKSAPFSKTHNGLPVSESFPCVNTLTMRNGWAAIRAQVYTGDRRGAVARIPRVPMSCPRLRSDDDDRRRSNHGHVPAVISSVLAIRPHNTTRHGYKAHENQ